MGWLIMKCILLDTNRVNKYNKIVRKWGCGLKTYLDE